MNSRTWNSQYNWWTKFYQEGSSFSSLWQSIVNHYANKIAYYDNLKGITYQQLEKNAQHYRQQFLGQKIIRINGLACDWLTQAIAAWSANQMVICYNPNWQEQDPLRYQLAMTEPQYIDWSCQPHLLLFTSGSTGTPKPVIRNTAFALYEAACYIDDVLSEQFECAISLIKPWFGAITKHCLGTLLAGIPQYFELPTTKNLSPRILIYGTPSLIANHATMTKQTWHALSLTGERINAHHIQAFKNCLHSEGFVIDAYGATECGVIARRKFCYQKLEEMIGEGFRGEILPGKQIHIDAKGLLYVKTFNSPPILTGDLATLDGNILQLIGRVSTKRKIRDVWLDTSPLINLLSSHPDIFHFEVSEKQTSTDQLIVYVCAKTTLLENDLYQWLFQKLNPLKLLPQLVIEHQQAKLGITGKQKIHQATPLPKKPDRNCITMMTDAIFNLPDNQSLVDKSLEQLGFDSIDIVSLMTKLKKKGANPLAIHAILKTDTPRQIAELLNQETILRSFESTRQTNQHIICIGSGILTARLHLSQLANIKYTDIIYHQKQNFSFSQLATYIIEKELKLLSRPNDLYLAGFSINCLLAIELAYQLEQRQIPVKGLFLLDPPNQKRVRYLKNKKIFLVARCRLLKHLLNHGQLRWQKRFHHEIRKIAILNQPKRHLNAPTLSVYSLGKFDKNPWLKTMAHHQNLELDFSGHLELVNTVQGIKSWVPLICSFLNIRTNH